MKFPFFALAFLFSATALAQDDAILKSILARYYQNEKVIVKDRNQLLFLFCEKPNNNEEIYETVNGMKLKPETARYIRQQVTADKTPENWSGDYEKALPAEHPLRKKVNSCLTLEEYQEKQQRFNLNNQRMMIVHKPIVFEKTKALVKVVFYRTIEHNSGSVLLMEKVGDKWEIRENLNPWST